MGMVSVTRGSSAPTMLRNAVKQGMTFAMRKRDGKQGTNYAAIGANGRLYSVNLETGEVASTSHEKAAARNVVQTGKWEFVVNNTPTPSVVRTCRRSELSPGEVYKNKDGEELFFHLGTISRDRAGFLSVPLARTENHSVSKNPNATVHVVATGEIRATVSG